MEDLLSKLGKVRKFQSWIPGERFLEKKVEKTQCTSVLGAYAAWYNNPVD